jgi:hypothetical protein
MSWQITCPSVCHHQQGRGSWGSPKDQSAHGRIYAGSLSVTSGLLMSGQ